jgi:CubicO group peptidase (beta-lactamase class C family)
VLTDGGDTMLLISMLLMGCASGPRCPGLPGAVPVERAFAAPDADWSGLESALRDQVEGACLPAMGVAIVDAEGVQYAASYGWSDVDAGTPIDADSPFLLASVSKMVLGLSLAQAEDEGALSLDDPVQDHLGFVLADPREGAEVRLSHLATHHSGIRDNWDVLDQLYVDGDSPVSLGEFMAEHLADGGRWYTPSRSFASWGPGEGSTYSNVGASLGALAVEGAVGQDYAVWSRDRFFTPLGMQHTGWFLADLPTDAAIARPTTRSGGGTWRVHEHYGFPTYPDGQLRSSAGDIGRLLSLAMAGGVWEGERVMSEAAVDRLLSEPHPELRGEVRADGVARQRVAWFDLKQGGRTLTGHDGSETGATTRVFMDLETGVGAVVLISTDTGQAEAAADKVLERLLARGEAGG